MMKQLFSVSPLPNSLAKINCQKISEQFFSSVSASSRMPGPDSLYRRITPVGDPAVSIVPVLDQWIRDGNAVDGQTLRGIVYVLKDYKRFKHALEVSQWMTDKRYIPLNTSDNAMRMNLILRVHGLEQVEKYFANIPQRLKSVTAHIALLNCYSWSKSVDKAEALMQKAKDMGYIRTPVGYNIMMNLHCNMGNFEKLDQLMDEMEERKIRPDQYTLTARLKAYTAVSDSNGIDSVVNIMKSDPQIIVDWSLLSVAATAYLKVGATDKALVMLEKMKLLMKNGKRKDLAVRILFQLYAKAGKKDEVYRSWNQYKEKNKIYNNIYISMMSSLMKLEDFEGVESLFHEWESSSGLSYDFKIVNVLIDAYCRLGNLEKAEAVLNKGILSRGNPNAVTWCNFAGGYIMENNVVKAIESLKKAISSPDCDTTRLETLKSCVEYLEGGKNIDDFIKSLNQKSVPSWIVNEKLFYFIKTGELSSRSGESSGEEDVMKDDEMMN